MHANGAHSLAQTKLGDGYILLYGDILCDRRIHIFLPKDILSCKLKPVTGKRWALCVKSHHNDNQLHLEPSAHPFPLDRL